MRMEIEIPDRIYEHAKEGSEDSRDESDAIYAIKNGIQLKTGKWIMQDELFKCSECGVLSCCIGKYCNECGAKMAESEEV